ncbi:hypothetical protein M378DRAFT_19572 [Amanita muscaria Koide BX008]|uniref:Uncharacterized protein n=1 Tax=Amanita muscaria (strain Koide BX008) TaxID=946122 RepID=A0A0C2WCL0_AMAMK|nr:hypothetical protein M378DRAFT_19572 [Amanita muscaria Koide BX008]
MARTSQIQGKPQRDLLNLAADASSSKPSSSRSLGKRKRESDDDGKHIGGDRNTESKKVREVRSSPRKKTSPPKHTTLHTTPQLLLAKKWDLETGLDPTGWWISEKLDGVR